MKATTVIDHDVSAKDTKRGKRVWFRSELLATRCKLKIGDKLRIVYNKNRITLVPDENGTLSLTASRGKISFDLHNKTVLKCLPTAARVFIELSLNEIVICLRRTDERIQVRIQNFMQRMKRKDDLVMGDLCSGVGGLAHSISTGFKRVGQGIKCAFAVDHWFEGMESAALTNPTYDDNTTLMNCSLEQAPLELMPQLDLLVTGLSCKAASRQARTGKKVSLPEFHEEAGWLVMTLPTIIQKTNPLCLVLENVVEYLDTASRHILGELLKRLGYKEQELILKGDEHGALEARKRGAVVYLTEGVEFDLIQPEPVQNTKTVGEILEPYENFPPVPESIDCPLKDRNGWYPKEVLLERQREAIEKGKGHRAKIIDPSDTKISTITASYGKGVRLDESVVESPCGKWLRLLSPVEHARAKGLPEGLASNLSKTNAHKALGNSVELSCWAWLGQEIAFHLSNWVEGFKEEKPRIIDIVLEKKSDERMSFVAKMTDGKKYKYNKTCLQSQMIQAKGLIDRILEKDEISHQHWSLVA
ncbi:DNA cytosine methyltransferase [Vibrio crassostreae]|uniref:DNA cytosine methyltransferase n=1 Tax=Vibrio crassostreae TaxID=246167 RepID=UPI001B30E294|nr:DNA cytosine methyltransferase [Vibrio crassostreae]